MKILYWTLSNSDINSLPLDVRADYLSDLLLHGLREIYGVAVVDIPKKDHMYKNWQGDTAKLWGRGFSYAKLLEDIPINRSDPSFRIPDGYYDLIVLSVHHTIHNQPHFVYNIVHQIKAANADQKIAVVDGHDTKSTYNDILNYTPYLFKREIPGSHRGLIPISFAIPKEKIRAKLAEKNKYIAGILPADHSHANRRTHIYTAEQDYYNDYATSYFGLTCKKGGWDCLRHYEIMANGCIPIFTDIENCSPSVLTTLPKDMLNHIKTLPGLILKKQTFDKNEITQDCVAIDESKFDKNYWLDMCEKMRSYCETFLTTKCLAKYFIGKIYA